MTDQTSETNVLELATELTIAWLSNPNTNASADEASAVLGKMHAAVAALGSGTPEVPHEVPEEFIPAVSVRRSLASKDHILSMIDGKPYKSLKRHLSTNGLTPEQYRERYKLKADYPMVSESYSQVRREMAKKIGLGRKPGQTVTKRSPAAKPAAVKKSAAPAAKPRRAKTAKSA